MHLCHLHTVNSWNFKRHGSEARVSQNNQIKMSLKQEEHASNGPSSTSFTRQKKKGSVFTRDAKENEGLKGQSIESNLSP